MHTRLKQTLNHFFINNTNFKILGMSALCISMAACGNAKSTTETKSADSTKSVSSASNASSSSAAMNAEELATFKKQLTANFKASGFETNIKKVTASAVPNLVWVHAEGLPSFFADKSGKFIIQGDVIELGKAEPIDISAPLKQADAKALLANVNAKDMIIYKPKGEVKSVVYAFTDVDCGYCRKLHSEMAQINDAGVEVRYLAWPRSAQSIPSMESIWCSDERNITMNTAKSGGSVTPKKCDNPVEAQVELGMQLGVRGTPAIFTESGKQIGGYLPPNRLAEAAKE